MEQLHEGFRDGGERRMRASRDIPPAERRKATPPSTGAAGWESKSEEAVSAQIGGSRKQPPAQAIRRGPLIREPEVSGSNRIHWQSDTPQEEQEDWGGALDMLMG